MKSKKSQIIGQVFIFLLASFLAILIITYGYRAIRSFTSRTEEISLVNFKTDLQSAVRTIASDYGSVKRLDLTMPGNYEMLCLIDLSKRAMAGSTCICNRACTGIYQKDYQPEICDAWQTEGYQNNAFLVPITPIKLSQIEIANGYLCIKPKGNKLSLRLEGLGDKTRISEWPTE